MRGRMRSTPKLEKFHNFIEKRNWIIAKIFPNFLKSKKINRIVFCAWGLQGKAPGVRRFLQFLPKFSTLSINFSSKYMTGYLVQVKPNALEYIGVRGVVPSCKNFNFKKYFAKFNRIFKTFWFPIELFILFQKS